jgi:hypothetical protein
MLGARAWVQALRDPEWPAWWAEMYACAMDFWLTLAYLNNAGDDEWNAYNLYQGRNTTYRFGSLQGAHPVAPGMIVLVCENPWYPLKVWVQETETMAELDEPRFGFVHSCAFDEKRDAWRVAIVVNLSRAGHVWEHPVWGVAYREIQRVEWYCQQFGAVVPYVLGEEAASVLSDSHAGDEDRLHAFVLWLKHYETSCSWSETATVGRDDVDAGALPLLNTRATGRWARLSCWGVWVWAPAAVAVIATAVNWHWKRV